MHRVESFLGKREPVVREVLVAARNRERILYLLETKHLQGDNRQVAARVQPERGELLVALLFLETLVII